MSEKAKKPQYEILVKKDQLTSKNLSPTPQELYDMMHLTSCEHAIKRWKEEWILCPVCSQASSGGDADIYVHKTRKELLA
jgi:hypothetical protein